MNKIVLVGDPNQLPPTLMSKNPKVTLFDRSLFERILTNGHNPYFLSIQYRMAPVIREFPSMTFYAHRLVDGPNIKERYDTDIDPILKPLIPEKSVLFFDISYGK